MAEFTPLLQSALACARAEADRIDSDSVGPEHLLLGLLTLSKGAGYYVLKQLSVVPETLHLEVSTLASQLANEPSDQIAEYPYTRAAKEVLAHVEGEARGLGHRYCGTEHLLLAIVHNATEPLEPILSQNGLTYDSAKQAVRDYFACGITPQTELPDPALRSEARTPRPTRSAPTTQRRKNNRPHAAPHPSAELHSSPSTADNPMLLLAPKKRSVLPNRDIVRFFILLRARLLLGEAIIQALTRIAPEFAPTAFGDIIRELHAELHGGSTFSETLQRRPALFSNAIVELIQCGENHDLLDETVGLISRILADDPSRLG